jgi:hypothetical protein
MNYESKPKGEKVKINGREFIKKTEPLKLTEKNKELVLFQFRKRVEWCNHNFIGEDCWGNLTEKYCERCGVVKNKEGLSCSNTVLA